MVKTEEDLLGASNRELRARMDQAPILAIRCLLFNSLPFARIVMLTATWRVLPLALRRLPMALGRILIAEARADTRTIQALELVAPIA